MKKIIIRILMLFVILLVTCEVGLRIRLAYMYKKPDWILYHQFKFRTKDEINKEDLPHYYKDNMFKPFTLTYKEEKVVTRKGIITVESSALRSIRRQLQKIVEHDPKFVWIDYSPSEKKEIVFSNNNVVLYELLIYPDIYNTLKREARILNKVFGPTIDDFLYHNLAFYMHIDENINFTSMNSEKWLEYYIELLSSREEPFCRSIAKNGFKNVLYVITPNKFDPDSQGGKIYLKYIHTAYSAMLDMLKKYGIPYIDLMNETVTKDDFSDYFHFSPEGGRKMSYKILESLKERGL